MFSRDTLEKTTMEVKTEDIVCYVKEWSLKRVADKTISEEDSLALISEFYEWIEPEGDHLEISYFEEES